MDYIKSSINFDLMSSEIITIYKETITEKSPKVFTISPNKHNKIYINAELIDPELIKDINYLNKDRISTRDLCFPKQGYKNYDYNNLIFSYDYTDDCNFNLIYNKTNGLQYLDEIKDSVSSGLRFVAQYGAIAEECLNGIQFNLLNVVLHTDAIHRGAGQIIPTLKRVILGAQLNASPRLVEPIYAFEINCNQFDMNEIINIIKKYNGELRENQPSHIRNNNILKGSIPVSEYLDFKNSINSETKYKNIIYISSDSWKVIDSDPFETNSKANLIAIKIRKQKGLSLSLPNKLDVAVCDPYDNY